MKKLQKIADSSAVGLSALCAIHCILTPLLLTVAPALIATPLADEMFHEMMLVVVIPLSTIALITSCFKHNKWSVIGYGALGLILMILAVTLGHDILGENGERMLTLIGAFIVAFAHIKNTKHCHQNSCHK